MNANAELNRQVADFVRRGFAHEFGRPARAFGSSPVWAGLRELGTELWLDTGSLEESSALWTAEFTALTTNNTLLNKEVQKGQYDDLIGEASAFLDAYGLSDRERMLELAFILNARHGLKLVEQYDAFVSVEEHTDLAHDVDAAVSCAQRYHAICPERFIVKIPFTPAGVLATRRVAAQGIPVNHTLEFSARQNYVVARVAKPAYVNVFLGRLNSFTADNGLGDGAYVGEKATLASQAAVRALRESGRTATRQIGASLRNGAQVRDLVGLDVLTMPPKAAQEFLELGLAPESLANKTGAAYEPALGAGAPAARLETLWAVDDTLVACCDALEDEDLDAFSPVDLVTFFADHGCGDLLVRWTDEQIAASRAEGKIPKLARWRESLAGGQIGLDSLMNLAGLNAFITDQAEMDKHVAQVLMR
ncbi:MAG: transaldolase family protein [Kiritimatiellae bacterium]|nr:transaldolase family protein [Kiritimatiellia bacterium]